MSKSKKRIVVLFTLLNIFSYAQSLKVMTYNIRLDIAVDGENDWTHRKDFFTSQIQFYEPDIFGVQEAKPNQVSDIANALSQYNYLGIGRDEDGSGESCTVYYDKKRFLVKKSNTFWLSETPEVTSKGWDAAYNRICTYALFKDLKNKKKFWLFNTHLDHLGEDAKTKSIMLILTKIKLLNTQEYPVIFMGDFNSEPNTKRIIELKEMMDDSRDISKENPFGPSGTFNNFKHNEPVTKLLDYIFISKKSKIEVIKYAVLSDSKDLNYPSDHLPIYVKINFK